MKKNKFIIIIAVILLVIAVILIVSSSSTTLRRDISNFTLEDTSNVVKIFLADKEENEVTLEKISPGEWQLNREYKASKHKVESLLKTMNDLRVRAPVSKAAHNTVVSRLATKSVKVEIYQKVPRINIFNWIRLFPHEKLTKTYYVGGATKDNLGTYMLMENSTKPYIVHIPMFRGFVTPRYNAKEDEWRDHTVFKHPLKNIRSIIVEFIEEPENSYKVFNIDNLNLHLINIPNKDTLKSYDTLKLLNFATAFKDIRFESLLTNKAEQEFIDSVTSSTPVYRIHVIDKSGDTTSMTTYNKKGTSSLLQEDGLSLEPFDLDRMYASINDDRDFVLIQFFVFDKVLRPLTYFTGY